MTHVGRAAALALVTLALVMVGACSPVASPSPGAVASSVASPVTGVPINIESEGFSKVTAFTIRTNAGEELRFVMGTLENGDQFPPSHLAEHLGGSTPVTVWFRPAGADLVAYRIEDAPVP